MNGVSFKLSVALSRNLEHLTEVLAKFGVNRKPFLSVRRITVVSKYRYPQLFFLNVRLVKNDKAKVLAFRWLEFGGAREFSEHLVLRRRERICFDSSESTWRML